MASSDATGAKFSDAIISSVVCWRFSSASSRRAISGSNSARCWLWSMDLRVSGRLCHQIAIFAARNPTVRSV